MRYVYVNLERLPFFSPTLGLTLSVLKAKAKAKASYTCDETLIKKKVLLISH
ncbi:hypothetical protein ACE6H2_008549 [Prunus campanulata]